MKPRLLLSVLLLPLVLAGCVKEPAAYLIEGGEHSLTVERNKRYLWSEGWELDLIVARYPDCQRRHALQKSGEKLRVDLFSPQPGVFILSQGSRWYVAVTKDCRMQQFDAEPPEPGKYLGSFRIKKGVFGFAPATEEEQKAAAGG